MATPTTFSVPPPMAEELTKALEEEARRQQEATPEPEFQKNNVVQSYGYLCEVEHRRFTRDEVDKFRMGISEPNYWECEARHYMDQLSALMWQKLLREYRVDSEPSAEGWRNVAMAYRHRLRRNGCSTQQMRAVRLSIEDQRYWQPEANCLRKISALREHEMLEEYLANIQGIPSPAESETRHEYLKKRRQRRPPKQSIQRLQPTVEQPTDMGRPGLRSSARVANRRRKVGANAR